MYRFRMPSLGADMEAGTLVEWDKEPGDAIRRSDIIAVVETEKGAIEVEIFVEGEMGKQLVPIGATVPVGTPIAEIEGVPAEEEEEHREEAATKQAPAAGPTTPAASAASAPTPSASVPPQHGEVTASPAARKLATEKGVALDGIEGSGPGGSIVLRDVEAAEAAAPPTRGLDLVKMRHAIAAAMAKSKREIPHYYLATEIDMSSALGWLQATNADRLPEKRLLAAIMPLKATALTARKFPAFNGHYDPSQGLLPAKGVHIGVAISIRGGGLVSPALHDCDRLDLDGLMERMRDLASRAREGRLRSSELSDATLTISSLGERGVESLYGVIYPPQVAILGFGAITHRPVAVEDRIEIRPMMTATLAADHRASDGHMGSRFLKHIAALLQEPGKL